MRIVDEKNHYAEGWGETPLSVQWAWPSAMSYEIRHEALKRFCAELASAWKGAPVNGHPLEVGYDFIEQLLPELLDRFNGKEIQRTLKSIYPDDGTATALIPSDPGAAAIRSQPEPMPWLAALVCNSAFDLALHDAFGRLADRPVYETYNREFLARDLAQFLEPAVDLSVSFRGKYPADFLAKEPARRLPAWHLVGGLDPIESAELTGAEPKDGHPILLRDWIERDGLKCIKVKLRGNDRSWDYQRLVRVAQLALPMGVEWLSADFNCTVQEPEYVNGILDDLQSAYPQLYSRILYVEQPFAYDLERHRINVHSVSSRKPLFLDESAHDWRMIRLGRELGWTGVALKTCKTQTGAILSACWARAHGMQLMVQDLTNPMLAQIPHVLLAAYVGTIMGVETNSMQFYPEASTPEAKVHAGLYLRRNGTVDLSSIHGPGFGYRLKEIERRMPEPAVVL